MRKSILLVGNFLSSTAVTRTICEELAQRLSGQGWYVLTTSSKKNKFARLGDMLRTIWTNRHQYDAAQVDVYSGQAFIWAEWSCRLLRYARKPFILTLHGGNLPVFAQRWPGRVRRLLRSAAVVTCPSRFLCVQLSAFRSDLLLLPNPIDIKQYPFHLRSKPGPHLMWLRAFHSIYNPVLAPRVLAALAREFPSMRLTMVGPDKQDGSLQAVQQYAEAQGLSGRVSFPGGVAKAEVPHWLNQGDIFLNTTQIDNTPLSVIEAMACGLVPVSTQVGGIPYLLDHNQDALLVPPDDPVAMANAVRRLLTEPGLAERLSYNGRQKVEAFDWSTILPRWEALFAPWLPGSLQPASVLSPA